ncbi:tunicamycin resistance protein [Tieghemiomyces parasiticus]|uniref:UDP-N-acetylglucosamine--dolichyl-phosphate N-acetylglucosaminephosphotransferase n=1 Tax=Tieghemiomyces parasiticus TaxID=78921 RepID=A0A9W8DQS7_9FUNG|nr:tunicamycin resistance protein [Tieghemiomyces parasiticus]
MSTTTVLWTAPAVLGLAVLTRATNDPLAISTYLAVLTGLLTWRLIPAVADRFVAAGLSGKDVNKAHQPIIPESLGIIAATLYLICLFLFIPFPFRQWFPAEPAVLSLRTFPFQRLGEFLAALLCLQSMVFLGFADDVFDIRWRYKLVMPTVASIPLLMGYYLSDGITYVVLPIPLRPILGRILDIGILYYVYIAMLAIFCTNSINILAGINGVEAGQSLVIALSVAANDLLYVNGPDRPAAEVHLFSLYFILPFIAVTTALLWHNWYPARVFVGDTYCYFAGMTFAVVGIIGHFSKTLLLFFIPQIFNFIYSAPQLFRLVPCPRHRMPRLNPATGRLEPSDASLATATPTGLAVVRTLARFRLVRVATDDAGTPLRVSNLTLLNLLLVHCGPLPENHLAALVVALQVFGSVAAFTVRYQLVTFLY